MGGKGDPEDYAVQAGEVKKHGFAACKMDPFAHVNYWYGEDLSDNLSLTEKQKVKAIDRLVAVQEAVGPDFPIAVETHGLLNGPTAVEMAHRIASANINCMWYEEPAGPEGPGTPCRPGGPGSPLGPGEAAAPGSPLGPGAPAVPAGPGGPIGPLSPLAP